MFKRKTVFIPLLILFALLAASCSGPGRENSSSVSSRESAASSLSSANSSESNGSGEDSPAQEPQPVFTKQASISNDFPELELKLFADRDESGRYHATRLKIYHASISDLPMQEINLDGCESSTPDFLLTVEDLNFDGVKDIRLVSSAGAQNTYCNCYVWDIGSASFQKDEVLSALPSLRVDSAARTLRFYEHGSAADYREGALKYLDGELTMIYEKNQVFDASANLFTITTKEFEGGSLKVTEEKTVTAEELEAAGAASSK